MRLLFIIAGSVIASARKVIWHSCREGIVEERLIRIKCLSCLNINILRSDNTNVRRFSEQPWLNHAEIYCDNCSQVIYWFAPAEAGSLEELEEQGLHLVVQEYASDHLRDLFYRAHGIRTEDDPLTASEEKQVAFLAWELNHMPDELLDDGNV